MDRERNFDAILNAIANNQIDVKPLITERIPLNDYMSVYGNIKNSRSIASILIYENNSKIEKSISITHKSFKGKKGVIGIIGSGNFTSSTVLPNLKKLNADIAYLASSGGLSSTTLAKKFRVANSTSDYTHILKDAEVDLVFITTRHNSHASMVIEAIKTGKSVFVEKPLAIKEGELDEIVSYYEKSNINISVGFNRRFAPLAQKMKLMLGSGKTPMNIVATMNAGAIPANVWVHDMEVGGGRILGEACHYIDLCTFYRARKLLKSV